MNQRARWQYRRTFFALLGILLACAAGTYLYRSIASWAAVRYAPQRVVAACVDVYDRHVADAIKDWFLSAESQGMLGMQRADIVAADLMNTFPLIRGISWQRYEPSVLRCTVYGVKPLYRVNDKYIVGNNGQLYTTHEFRAYDEPLPQLRVSKQWLSKTLFPAVFRFFASLPARVFASYNIFYHDPYMVVLAPADETFLPRAVCVADEKSADKALDIESLRTCANQVLADTGEQASRAYVVCDVRFDTHDMSKIVSFEEYETMQRVDR